MAQQLTFTARTALLLMLALTALASGCGDSSFRAEGGGGGIGSALANHVKERLGGEMVELTMYTSCEGVESGNPETRCAGIVEANIEVFYDGSALIFDFSNGPRTGRISDLGFEGYVLAMTETSTLPPLVDATVDAEASTVDAAEVGIRVDSESVAVSFDGLVYDDSTVIKVNLAFDED